LTRAARADVIVAGAGLVGCLAAAELARSGRRVVVVAVTPGEAPPLGVVPSGPTLAYADAVARFGREPARELWSLQREARGALRRLLAGWRGPFDERAAGGFLVAHTRAEGLALADSEDLLREDGFAGEFLDNYMLEARFDVRGLAAGYWAEDESDLDGRAVAQAARAAALEAGVAFAGPVAPSRLHLAADGVRAETDDKPLRAPAAVIATAAARERLPGLGPRAGTSGRHGIRVPAPPEALLPWPVRALDGRFAWTVAGGAVTFDAYATADPAVLLSAHLPALARPHESAVASAGAVSFDGLPLCGPVPGLPAVAVLGARPDLGWLPLLPGWAVSSLLTGRDTTPALLRAAREPSAML
jgi:glycine/D-amino acid oxidase-like deaminating enzyme